MHRELPDAESADLTPNRYRPRRPLPHLAALAQFYTNELNARVRIQKLDLKDLLMLGNSVSWVDEEYIEVS